MSHIPNSAMPHAGPQPEIDEPAGGGNRFAQLAEIRSGVADMVRDHPRAAAVAGAAVVGLAAAAAIPAIRGRSGGKDGSKKKKD